MRLIFPNIVETKERKESPQSILNSEKIIAATELYKPSKKMESFLKNIKGIWDIFLPAVLENPISLGVFGFCSLLPLLPLLQRKRKQKKKTEWDYKCILT